jgi:signal transduction histidine kinase
VSDLPSKNKIIKARFRGVNAEEKASFSHSRCLLPISVDSVAHEDERFAATIDYVNQHFDSCILLLGDTLQRYTIAFDCPDDPNSLTNVARARGDAWLVRNEKYYRKLNNLHSIERWDSWRNHPEFPSLIHKIDELLATNVEYKAAFETSAEWFVDKYVDRLLYPQYFDRERAKQISLQYLKEESVVLCLCAELECQFEAYPGNYPAAVDSTRYYFMASQYPHLQRKILIDFRNASVLAPQANRINLPGYIQILENVLSEIPASVYWMNREGVYLGCNDSQAKVLNLKSRSEVVGKRNVDFKNLLGDEVITSLDATNEKVMDNLNVVTTEDTAIISGEKKTFLSTKKPIFNDAEEVVGMVGISLDITDRKIVEQQMVEAKERAEVANQAKSYFMASLGHEFRTPLNHIIGLAEIIKGSSGKLSIAELEDYANNISASGFDLLELINDTIMFSRMETGHFKVEKNKVVLREVMQRVINSSLHRAEEKSLKLSLDYSESLPSTVLGDAQRIRQVLTNLIDNALKFTNSGTIQIVVKKDDRAPDFIAISIEDTGIGIPADKHNLVFERFSQVHSEHTDQRMGKYKGVGLGLAIVKQLVELMGGTIRLESQPGIGSKFEFTLPTVAVGSDVKIEVNLEPKFDPIVRIQHNNKILVVEDNPLAIRFIEFILKELELSYDVAKTGQQALDFLEKNTYRFVLMDLGLPDIDGLECIRRYRSIKSEQERSPIIILTAQGIDEGRDEIMAVGVNDYIEKPLKKERLEELLKKY